MISGGRGLPVNNTRAEAHRDNLDQDDSDLDMADPSEADPGEADPGEVDPGEVDPGDVDHGEVDHGRPVPRLRDMKATKRCSACLLEAKNAKLRNNLKKVSFSC